MYQALYRKWRPMDFEDVVSQSHITKTLKNQIRTGKTAHAYLFTGSRGTGKTTCARIFAKTVNCPNEKDGSPCLKCDICKAADEGVLNDIIEIDAASNTGVDDIRELRDSAAFMPERGKYKVYIIDEVHMISQNAFNALLKIMEEPPEHVKFILATTEVHKVPATIISRCQRFDFRRLLPADIVARLMYIAGEEKIQLDEKAAYLIAKLSDGAMRDALSILDQCMAYSEKVDEEVVSSAVGIAGRGSVYDLLESIVAANASEAIGKLDRLYEMSKDMQRLCEEMLMAFRDMMLIKSVPGKDELLSCLPDEAERLKEFAGKMELGTILDKLTVLQECNERLPKVSSKRIEIEMCFLKLCGAAAFSKTTKSPADSRSISELERRIARLESAVSSGKAAAPAVAEPLVPAKQSDIPEPVVDTGKIKEEDLSAVSDWGGIVERVMERHPEVGGFLAGSKGFIYENVVFIIVDNDFFLKMFKQTDSAKAIQDVLRDYFGKTYAIRVKSAKNVSPEDKDDPLRRLIDKAKNADIQVDIKQ